MNEITIPPLVPAATSGNLTNLIAERAWFEPNRTMLSRPLGDGWQKVSAQELEAEVRATAKGLIAAGIQIGDRVAIMARTRYEWTILDFAIWFAGGCVVPIYETSSAEQVDWILSDSGAVGLIVETPSHRELVNPVLPSHTKHVWTMTEDVLAVLATAGAHVGDDEIDRRRNALLPDTLATLIYTSGTTGKPKGVQLTHGNFEWSEAPSKVTFSLEDANLLTKMDGAYILKSLDADTTSVTYELSVGLSMPIPAMMIAKQEKSTIDSALKQLKEHIEG